MIKIAAHGPFLLLVLSISVLACRVFSPVQTPPDYLTVGIESNPTRLDPRYATDANSARIGSLIYNSLVRIDENGRVRGDLAENWSVLDDRTYSFHIRRGVTFHDGRPLTAADVKFTYDSILEPRNRSPKRAPLKFLESIEQLGSDEVRFRLSSPYGPFLEQCTIGIVPDGAQASADAGYTMPPPGSGPFAVAAFSSGEKLVLKANASYWEGKPKLAGVTFTIVPDATVRVLEFKKGSIQLLQNDIEPDTVPWLEKKTDGVIETRQGTTFQYIGINLTHPILKHQKVRQALAYAIDRDRIIRYLLKGQAIPANGLLSPLQWAYDDTVPQRPYQPSLAKKLLDDAGFIDPDGDGPKARFKLSFKTTNIDLRRRVAEAMKEQLRDVGIELEIRTYEWGTFYSDVKKGNFHLFSLAWVGISDPDIYYNIFHSRSVPPDGDNRGRYRNPTIDDLLEQGRRETDQQRRRAIYRRVQNILHDDLPYVPLWWVKNVVVRKPQIVGFTPYPDGDFVSLKQTSLRGDTVVR